MIGRVEPGHLPPEPVALDVGEVPHESEQREIRRWDRSPRHRLGVEAGALHLERETAIGEVSNDEHNLRQYGKAGSIRWKGIRPTVRGVAMNPVDHPHGGGEGRTGEGQVPVSPWNTMTKGYRTRNNKRTQTMIVSRRKK